MLFLTLLYCMSNVVHVMVALVFTIPHLCPVFNLKSSLFFSFILYLIKGKADAYAAEQKGYTNPD